jgi:hypothetical protein
LSPNNKTCRYRRRKVRVVEQNREPRYASAEEGEREKRALPVGPIRGSDTGRSTLSGCQDFNGVIRAIQTLAAPPNL